LCEISILPSTNPVSSRTERLEGCLGISISSSPSALNSASQSPAPPSLQRLPFSSDYHSPAPSFLQRLPFSSATISPATCQRLASDKIPAYAINNESKTSLEDVFLSTNVLRHTAVHRLSTSAKGVRKMNLLVTRRMHYPSRQ
jgi:hypothetical protein